MYSSFLFATNRARIRERVQEEGMESLANISEKFLDNFPEYVTYPERKRLVDADKVRFGVAFSPYLFITPSLLSFCKQIASNRLTHQIQTHAHTTTLGAPLSLGRFPEFMELAEKVEACFKGESLEEVVEGLRADNSAWAQECLRRMEGMSPLR